MKLSQLKKSKVSLINEGVLNSIPKKSKYGSKKTVVDGIKFDSQKEAKRYQELKIMKKQGIISGLELQPVFELNEGGKFSYKYKADFLYYPHKAKHPVIEDCKGFKTAVYKKKKKLMKKVYGIDILET